MSSEIKANSIQDKTGTRVLASDSGSAWSWGSGVPTGSILQVIQTPKTDTTSCTTADTLATYTSASITTKVTNSKILVLHTVEYGGEENKYSYGKYYRTVSGDSDVQLFIMTASTHGANSGNGNWSISLDIPDGGNYDYHSRIKNFNILDAPAKSSGTAITYVFKGSASATGGDILINGCRLDPGNNSRPPGCTSTTLIEITS